VNLPVLFFSVAATLIAGVLWWLRSRLAGFAVESS
jgi:hypothetical protein